MGGVKDSLASNDDIDKGISTISTDDWIKLTTFFDAAVYDAPKTEAKMRIKLGMQSGDEFRTEFGELTTLYAKLSELGGDFQDDVVEEVLSLSDDIVHYQIRVEVVYPRLSDLVDRYDFSDDTSAQTQKKLDELVKLWGAGKIDGRSEKIKTRLKSALESLIAEASVRADRAEALQETILGDGGQLERLKTVKADFDAKKTEFNDKFGDESADVKQLKSKAASVASELEGMQKKDTDEVIVLSTSPVYLAIPVIGPFVMAGVLIGVGVDLANVRAKIDSLQKEAEAIEKQLKTTERFKTYYETGCSMVSEMALKIEKVTPKLKQVGLGWRAIAADIGDIVKTLSEEGRANIKGEDWFNFVSNLDAARGSWKKIGEKADHFRTVAQPQAAKDVDELVAGGTQKAA